MPAALTVMDFDIYNVAVAAVAMLVLFYLLGIGWRNKSLSSSLSSASAPLRVSSCPNPNCIRCQRYRQIQSNAKRRMPWVVRQVRQQQQQQQQDQDLPSQQLSLDRICDSIQHPQKYCTALQAPTVLMVRDLTSQEVVTDVHHFAADLSSLSYKRERKADDKETLLVLPVDIIIQELSQESLKNMWTRNDSPTGTWEVLPVLNQGEWNQHMAELCPQLIQTVKHIPNLLDNCLFGNVMVSKIFPGTDIEPHCGPTNVRHRLQYTLQVPPRPVASTRQQQQQPYFLRVGRNKKLSWSEAGSYFVFDDSFVHSVRYQGEDDDKNSTEHVKMSSRMVLIVDLWNPDLTLDEQSLIRYMYPPFFSSQDRPSMMVLPAAHDTASSTEIKKEQ